MQAEEAAPGAVDRRGLPVDEHAALRRIATLIAEGAPVAELFQALSQEVVKVLGVRAVTIDRYDHDGTTTTVGALSSGALQVGTRWPLEDGSLAAMVFETGRPARIDDYGGLAGPGATAIRSSGFLRAVAAPVMVDGVVWGMLWVGTDASEPLPAGLETRLLDFTELIAVAVSNADARDRLRRSAEQEASLRRVATLVAQGASPNELFSAVTEELARILNVLSVSLIRYELDGTSIVLASFNDPSFRVNSRWPQDGHSLNSMVLETARPARIDDYSALPGPVAEAARASGVQSGIGAPIVVDGEVWGMIAVGRRQHREVLPDFTGSYTSRMMFSTESPEGIESRLAAFTELVGTAISRAQAQDQLHHLATEQAALRRVATLVAQGADSQVVFDAVCEETCSLVGASTVNLSQFTSDGFNLTRAGWSLRDTHVLVGTRLPIAPDDTVDGMVKQSGGPARIDGYDGAASELATLVRDRGLRSSVAAPVFVGGQLWGALVASTDAGEVLPRHTEVQLASFTELIATAVSNAADPLRADRLPGADRRCRRRGAATDRAQPPRRHPAATPRTRPRNAGAAGRDPAGRPGAGRHRPGRSRARGGPAGGARALTRPPPGTPHPRRAEAVPEGPRPAVADPGRAARRRRRTAAPLHRDGRVLRRLRGDHQRDQALAGIEDHRGGDQPGERPAGVDQRQRGRRSRGRRRLRAGRSCRPGRGPRRPHCAREPRRRRDQDLGRLAAQIMSTGLVGVLMPLINDSYFTAMLAGVAEGVNEQGLKLVLCPTWHEHAREVSLLERLRHETDGTLLILPEHSSDELARILSIPYPVVVIDPLLPVDERIPAVLYGHATGAEQAMRHLLALGHRRIAAITGPPGWMAEVERLRGYKAALAAAGLEYDPALVLTADFEVEPGAEAAGRLLELPERPTAIFCFNDWMAVGAMRAAHERGLRVPGDVSVMGYGDVVWASLPHADPHHHPSAAHRHGPDGRIPPRPGTRPRARDDADRATDSSRDSGLHGTRALIQVERRGPARRRERLVEQLEVLGVEPELERARRSRERARRVDAFGIATTPSPPEHPRERDLRRRGAVLLGDLADGAGSATQRAAVDRRVRHERHAPLAAPRQQVELGLAAREVVEHLVGRDPSPPATATSSARSSASKLLTPQWRILPSAFSSRECLDGLRERVAARASAAGRGRSGRSGGARGCARRRRFVPSRLAFVGQHLADEEDLVPAPVDRVADELLGGAVAVHLGRVDQRQAELEAEPERAKLLRAGGPLLAHLPRPLAEDGNPLARGQSDRSH